MFEKAPRLAVFDVDGTLIPDRPDELSGRAFWHFVENGIFRPDDETLLSLDSLRSQFASSESFAERRQYFDPLIQTFDNEIKRKSTKDVRKGAFEIIENTLSEIHPTLMEEIEEWRDQGTYLGIISGSPNILIQPLKHQLGFDIATGTRYHTARGEFHEYRPAETRGSEKHLIASRWVEKLGYGATLAAAYGDSIYDQTLLESAVRPVAVTPKENLRTIALERNWDIIE